MTLFDIAKLEEELKELENKTLESDFWNDQKNSGRVLAKIKNIKAKCSKYEELKEELENLLELTELVEQEESLDDAKEVIKSTKKLEKDINKLELETLFTGKYDENNAIISIHPGAGGQSHKIGLKCYIECTQDGQIKVNLK